MAKLIISIMLALVLLQSCRTQKPSVEIPVRTETIVKDRIIEVKALQDSSLLSALFECDSNNQVVMTEFNELHSKFMSISSQVQQAGNGVKFEYRTRTNPPDTLIVAHDRIINREVPVEVITEVQVEKSNSFIHQAMYYSGVIAWLTVLLFLLIKFIKFKIQ